MSTQQEKFKAIADKIREKLNTTDLIKPSEFVNKIDEVYLAGQNSIPDGGDVDLYEAGKQQCWSDMWDTIQANGNRVVHNMAFSSNTWKQSNYRPKYDMNVTQAERMFYQFNYGSTAFDLVEHLASLPNSAKESGFGIDLNFTNCTRFYYAFASAAITRLGIIDMSKSTSNENAFNNSKIVTIDKLIVSETTSTSSMFASFSTLVNIIVEGKFGKSVTFAPCTKLSKASMESIIAALSDTTSNLTCTFKTATKTANFTDEEWAALIATKPNWEFVLAN